MQETNPQAPIDKVVALLESAYKADPAAIHTLIFNRIPCNHALADHPEVVVDENVMIPDGGPHYAVGLIGIINGIVHHLTGEKITIKLSLPQPDGSCKFLGFGKLKEFPRYEVTQD